jgi:hypothetical protein
MERTRSLAPLWASICIGLAVWGAALPARAHRAPLVPRPVCHHDWREGTRELKQLITCAARRWGVPGGARKALAVARCESGLRPRAYNPAGYAGVYQQALVYWDERARHFGFAGRSPFNGRANVIVSLRMASAVGWGPWGCG